MKCWVLLCGSMYDYPDVPDIHGVVRLASQAKQWAQRGPGHYVFGTELLDEEDIETYVFEYVDKPCNL